MRGCRTDPSHQSPQGAAAANRRPQTDGPPRRARQAGFVDEATGSQQRDPVVRRMGEDGGSDAVRRPRHSPQIDAQHGGRPPMNRVEMSDAKGERSQQDRGAGFDGSPQKKTEEQAPEEQFFGYSGGEVQSQQGEAPLIRGHPGHGLLDFKESPAGRPARHRNQGVEAEA